VTHLSTSKESHCAHVSPLPTVVVALSSLWWGPKLGTLPTSTTGLLLARCPKSKVLITRNCLLLLLLFSRSLDCKPNLVLDEVILHPLPCRHNLPGNNAPYKWTPRFGAAIHSLPHQRVRVHNLFDGCQLISDLSVSTKE
jgi:hypothetical protein